MSDKPIATAEASIVINGHPLTQAQAMTIRCALENMAADLVGDGLGDDEHGSRMTAGYLARIRELREIQSALAR